MKTEGKLTSFASPVPARFSLSDRSAAVESSLHVLKSTMKPRWVSEKIEERGAKEKQ